jgi:hypothetical protein
MQFRLLFFFMLAAAAGVYGQTKTGRPTALHPNAPPVEGSRAVPNMGKKKVLAARRKAAFRSAPVRRTAQYEFYERVERAAKMRQRLLIEQARQKKGYFGHRKKPKKRPPHKMRYCNECGIRH